MPARFSRRFPDEVILEIVRQVDDVKTLAACSRASKQLHDFAESYLYSTFTQVDDGGEAMPLFLRSILRKPHLGRYVKRWIGISCHDLAIEANKHFRTSDRLLLQSAVQYVRAAPLDSKNWHSLALNGNWDAMAAVLICLLPNLEEMNFIEYGSNEGFPYLESMLHRAAILQKQPEYISQSQIPVQKDLHRYPEEKTIPEKIQEIQAGTQWPPVDFGLFNLHHVTLSYEYEDNFHFMSIEAIHILPFLDLNSIKYFSAHMVGGSFTPLGPLIIPAPTLYTFPLRDFKFQTSELILKHSTLEGVSLENFLRYFVSLKRFEYNFDYDFEIADQEHTHIDCCPPQITTAISHLKDTLEELSITQEKYRFVILEPGADQPINPLTEFTKLRTLTASANMLLGRHPLLSITYPGAGKAPEPTYPLSQIENFTQLFPPNLEHLMIRHCDSAIFEAMVALLRGSLPPKLKTIELEFQEYCDCGSHDETEMMMKELAGQRNVVIHSSDQGPHTCIVCYEKWARRPRGTTQVGDWSLSQNNWFEWR